MRWQRRIMSLVSAVAAISLAGCGITDTINNEVTAAYEPVAEAVVWENGSGKGNADRPESLDSLEKVLENEYAELYIGAQYDVVLYDKGTGAVVYSNAAYYDMTEEERAALSSEGKKTLFSQVSVEYYNSAQKRLTMSSYPDAYSEDKNQVSWSVDQDTLTVTYSLGTNMEESAVVQAFTAETYEYYDRKLQELKEAGTIGILDYRNFVNNYTAYDYETMSDSDRKAYLEMYPALEEYGKIYVLKSKLNNKSTNDMLTLYSLLGIDEGVKEAEREKLGDAAGGSAPAYFRIPVQYRLQGRDLVTSVSLAEITMSEGYYLTRVDLLKCFGATTEEEEGYLFVPDGSGSIIENAAASNSMDTVTVSFYGEDESKQMLSGTSIAVNNSFPVFGLKKENCTVFAIVENGAAIGGMTAQIHSNYLNYNIAYPWFHYQAMDTFGIEGVSYAFYDVIPDVSYTVRYHLLYDEEATYSGMARYYRSYLEQTGALKRREAQASDSLPLDVEMIGSVAKKVNYAGIPMTKSYALTTFDQAEEIASLLREGGVSSLDVLFTGAVNEGMSKKALNRVKVQRELGGLTGYRELNKNMEGSGDALYTGLDFTRIYERGNGIRSVEDVSKYLNRTSVLAGDRNSGLVSVRGLRGWLVNPLRLADITENFLREYKKIGSDKLYLETVGSSLNANYSQKEGVTRHSAQLLTEDMLETLYDNGYKLKLDVGNDYVLPYADSLVNVPTGSSNQRIESYSIPFVGMVLKGYLPYSSGIINQSANSERAILEAIESGAGLHYLLIYQDQLSLQNTDFSGLYSVNYQLHLEELLEKWNVMDEQLGALSNVRIMEHEHLSEHVNAVTYEDGTKIYVNYGKEAYAAPEGTVEAMSWLVSGR